ncbi:MAG: DUF5717 family protein [Clostridiales bacterium]|nr:DUF5717 family protein [Clostridiales bacterium]
MRIEAVEAAYDANPTARAAARLAVAQWLEGRLQSPRPAAAPLPGMRRAGSKESVIWQKAYFTLTTAAKRRGVTPEILTLTIFMQIELGNLDLADDMLKDLNQSRKGLKSANLRTYMEIMFLWALLWTRRQKGGKATKQLRQLRTASEDDSDSFTPMLEGILMVEAGDYQAGYDKLHESYTKGSRSPFLFAYLFDCFAMRMPKSDPLLAPFTKWALAHGADLYEMGDDLASALPDSFFADARFRESLCKATQSSKALKRVCERLMDERNYSAQALEFYDEAEKRRLNITDLEMFILSSSFRNRSTSVSRAVMERCLAKIASMELGLAAYCWHLVLSVNSLATLANGKDGEILYFAKRCVDSGLKGKFVLSLYQRLALSSDPDAARKKAAEDILWPQLFAYEAKADPGAIKILVLEPDRRNWAAFEATGGVAFIEAASLDHRCVALDSTGSRIMGGEVVATPMLAKPDPRIYKHFYNLGHRSFPLLATLSKAVIKEGTGDINILFGLLRTPEASRELQSSAKAALGSMLARANRKTEAAEAFKGTDTRRLSDQALGDMLAALASCGEFEKAAALIAKCHWRMPDNILFNSLKDMVKSGAGLDAAVEPAYQLTLKHWHDKSLSQAVMERYKCGLDQMAPLLSALDSMSAETGAFRMRMLVMAVKEARVSESMQEVFASVHERSPRAKAVADYAAVLCRGLIFRQIVPLYETIGVLEKIYIIDRDPMLALALSSFYLSRRHQTEQSPAIIEDALGWQEREGVLLPVFKDFKDQMRKSSYIERNHPFIHESQPGKTAWLEHAPPGGEPRRKKMKYLGFGMYLCCLPMFYGEKLNVRVIEGTDSGSVATRPVAVEAKPPFIQDDGGDLFLMANNAAIKLMMLKGDEAEAIIERAIEKLEEPSIRLL